MDMSFANQALSAAYLVERGRKLENKVYTVPEEIDRNIAKMKLATLGITIDTLTKRAEDLSLLMGDGHVGKGEYGRKEGGREVPQFFLPH